ncbi:MAG: hypothetical protein KH290_08635 [Roseburia sp.]|nr:hypothetical protein [Roseburia sp.]
MQKKNLIVRAERWKSQSEKMPLMGYPRTHQSETLEISVAIIKRMCEMPDITPARAKLALKMAADIIDEESCNDPMT